MLSRLEAEREIHSINSMTLAFGGVRPFDRLRHMSRLERLANGATETARPTPATLSAMGIMVIQVPAAGEGQANG